MTTGASPLRGLASPALLLLAALSAAGAPAPIAPVLLLDTGSDGKPVRLSELGPGPFIVAPIFTSCRSVCNTVARTLASTWGPRGPAESPTPVVLVSFDPHDTAADLSRFRHLSHLPPEWQLATLEREEGLRFFESLGFRWRTLSERQFDHSGKIFVLSDRLEVTAVLGPDQLTTRRLSAEVNAARSGASVVRRLGTHWVGFFGVGSLLLLLIALVAWDGTRMRGHENGR